MVERKAGSIEIEEDRRFQERFWSAERAAWLGMALIMLVALAGLTGQGGLLAQAQIAGPGATLDYPRVTRWESSDHLRLTLAPGRGDQAAVEIGGSFSKIFQIEQIQPAPAESYATPDGQRLVFDLRGPAGTREIIFHVRAIQPSLSPDMEMRVDGGPALNFTPTVLP